MSHEATDITYRLLLRGGYLRARLKSIDVGRRPGFGITRSVVVYLADRYRPDRPYIDRSGVERSGYVNESVPQIMAALDEKEGVITNVLRALHELDPPIAEIIAKGNQHTPTKRRLNYLEPGYFGQEQPQADLGMLTEPSEGEQPQADLGMLDGSNHRYHQEHPQVTGEQPQADLGTPHSTPIETPERAPAPDPRDLVRMKPDEAGPALAGLRQIHGPEPTDAALTELAESGAVFTWSSDLARAIEQTIDRSNHKRNPSRAWPPVSNSHLHRNCPPPCDGHGYRFNDNDEYTGPCTQVADDANSAA